ncbi:hypothetical protein E1264_08330 [Actinomadura sp. KC216]|uniref:hypothetical protein n=1 Tax=Actinomadura sp. KC216 TaxID=2530370 RepID=UPI00104D6E35|nr:hypothetical protein [Actinomadura sp. KC216]TDB89410.1 hypothetical protein E1264_08330 [Actinomadura sp. KC216]
MTSEPLTLFALLGVTSTAGAAAKLPDGVFADENLQPLAGYLNSVLEFGAVRPGAAADRVGMFAEVAVKPHPDPHPMALRRMPDLLFLLRPVVPARPVRLFVTQSGAGVEVVIEGLPVEIRLPPGLVTPLTSTEVKQGGPFAPGFYDTFEAVLRDVAPSSVFVHLRVRLTEESQVVIEPAVPISFGPCRFSALPCRAVHDFGLLPYPQLTGEHTEHELALEWTRHPITDDLGGLFTVRTLDLDHTLDPIKGLVDKAKDKEALAELEFVLEDLALPVMMFAPITVHGRFGLRRAVLAGADQPEAYDLTLAPVEIELPVLDGWRLKIFRLLFETPATAVVRMAVLFGDREEEDQALLIDVTDGWLVQGAWVPPKPLKLFTFVNVTVSLMTVKLGYLLRHVPDSSWDDHVRLLCDIGVQVGESTGKLFRTRVEQTMVLRDLGWDQGEVRLLPDLWFPESLKLYAFDVVHLEVEEVAFLSEDNGGRYISFSGGASVYPGAGDRPELPFHPGPPGELAPVRPAGGAAGLRFRRLRLRTGGGEQAAEWLLDGVSLFVRKGRLELSGSGGVTDIAVNGHRVREFALGLLLRFPALGTDVSVGAQFAYGRVTGPVENFTYWLFGVQLSHLPLGFTQLRNVRALGASGLSPLLPEPSGRPQEMRLLDWYKQHSGSGAVELRGDRDQQRGGWRVDQGAVAGGIGADITLPVGKAVFLRSFIFVYDSDSTVLFVAADVFALKNKIGTGAVEVGDGRWSALVEVDIDLAKLLDTDSSMLKGLAKLAGRVVASDSPATFAIGRLADQATWLTLSMDKTLLGLSGRVSVAFAFEMSRETRGAGFALTLSVQGLCPIGKVQLYAAFGLLVGVWGNEAGSSGFIAWAEVALRIKVFQVFSFGAVVKAVFEQLGPQEPNYRRVSLEVRIETPWWLPDVTWRVTRIRETPQPEAMPVLSAPLLNAGALDPGTSTETALAATELGAPGAVHSVTGLSASGGPIDESVWAGLAPVSVDSVIAVDLAVAVGNETTAVPSTPVGAGRQAATPPAENQLSATYTLVRVGVRRRPRFGPGAGVWTDLLAPADSEIGGLGDLLNDPDLSVRFRSEVRFRWDADVVTDDDTVDPRRLLVNADTPYTFLTGSPAVEEGLLAKDPSFPCCFKRPAVDHVLDFVGLPAGSRVPVVQRFTESESTMRWVRPPVVVANAAARVLVTSARDLTIAVVTFDEPAFMLDLTASWRPVALPDLRSALVVEAVRGLSVVDRQVIPLHQGNPAMPIRCQDAGGITSVTLRYERQAGPAEPAGEWLEIQELRYRTVREERDRLADEGRCGAHAAGGGKLAWLPNHDYEIALTVRATVDYDRSVQEVLVVQRAGFRTRGLPGLNATVTPGTELEPYVESVYGDLLYRREPIVLAFDERFNSLLPVDRTPPPNAPAERTQLLEWVPVVSQLDGERLSVPSADWVVAHRATPPPIRAPRVIDGSVVQATVRHAPTLRPMARRLENLEVLSPSCDLGELRLHFSQVLAHGPTEELWPARATLRVAVREKAGPHVSRRPFAAGDETAFTPADEGLTTASAWRVGDGALTASGAPGLRHYALFGEATWDHIKINAEFSSADGEGAAAGIAVAVSGLPRVDRALVALIDAGRLRLLARRGGATQQLATAPLPAGGPYALEVLVFDDRVRARVGEVSVEAARGDLREGRVAVVLSGSAGCTALHVDGLDAYITHVTTSRYASFEEHIGSWDGQVRPLPGNADGVAALRVATIGRIPAVMAGDPQIRQRLFDRWISELAIPLSPSVPGLRLGSVGPRLLVLESPERLPFSRDVSLRVTHTSQGQPPSDAPRELLEFAAGLVFGDGVVDGPISTKALPTVSEAHTLVHSVRGLPGPEYRLYSAEIDGTLFHGDLGRTRKTPPHPMPLDHIRLLDASGKPLGPALPLPVERTEEIDLSVLTNSTEDRALLIPAAPLAPDTYNLTWTIDRPRYRSADDNGHYRATVSTETVLAPTATLQGRGQTGSGDPVTDKGR